MSAINATNANVYSLYGKQLAEKIRSMFSLPMDQFKSIPIDTLYFWFNQLVADKTAQRYLKHHEFARFQRKLNRYHLYR